MTKHIANNKIMYYTIEKKCQMIEKNNVYLIT